MSIRYFYIILYLLLFLSLYFFQWLQYESLIFQFAFQTVEFMDMLSESYGHLKWVLSFLWQYTQINKIISGSCEWIFCKGILPQNFSACIYICVYDCFGTKLYYFNCCGQIKNNRSEYISTKWRPNDFHWMNISQ